MSYSEQIVKDLIRIRESMGKSQSELAREIGTTRSTVNRIEAGRMRLTADYLVAFALALGVSIDELIRNGANTTGGLSATEHLLLMNYRAADDRGQDTIREVAQYEHLRARRQEGKDGTV